MIFNIGKLARFVVFKSSNKVLPLFNNEGRQVTDKREHWRRNLEIIQKILLNVLSLLEAVFIILYTAFQISPIPIFVFLLLEGFTKLASFLFIWPRNPCLWLWSIFLLVWTCFKTVIGCFILLKAINWLNTSVEVTLWAYWIANFVLIAITICAIIVASRILKLMIFDEPTIVLIIGSCWIVLVPGGWTTVNIISGVFASYYIKSNDTTAIVLGVCIP